MSTLTTSEKMAIRLFAMCGLVRMKPCHRRADHIVGSCLDNDLCDCQIRDLTQPIDGVRLYTPIHPTKTAMREESK